MSRYDDEMAASLFLTAQWRYLLMANYEVDAHQLIPYLPLGTEIDTFAGKTLISLVGFWFTRTKVLGIPIPFHQNFPEVNVRFYVKRKVQGEWRRGVVFIKEIVPKSMIAWVANTLYGEPYVSLPMSYQIPNVENNNTQQWIRYSFYSGQNWNEFQAQIQGEPQPWKEESEEEFITEHYYGYTKRSLSKTNEYEVSHPPWKIWPVLDFHFSFPSIDLLYPSWIASVLQTKPSSVFVADGSPIAVYHGKTIAL